MTDWTAGYVADIVYSYGYYHELNPLRVKLAFLTAGLVTPAEGTHCELGFGQGVSMNIHAAASGDEWYGTDFNPSQASFAQELAKVSEAQVHLYDQSFAEFCIRDNLPDFDSIGLHGIWSWISDENRAVIVDFIRRKLKVGGVLYISYNTQPGWAAMVPMRDLLTEHAEVLGADGFGIVHRIDAALEFVEKLIAVNPAYARVNPQVPKRLKEIKEQNRNYLAHEYFNREWLPMPFSRMIDWLAPTKLQWACSANYIDAIDTVNLTSEQIELLKGIHDPMFRQTVRDFCVDQQFRKDYWVKGARNLTTLEQSETLRMQRIILAQPRADVRLQITASLGEVTLQEAAYGPILDQLADYKPKTLGQLEQDLKTSADGHSIDFPQLLQAALLLSGSGALLPVQDEVHISKAKKHTKRLNAMLIDKARGSNAINYLASPVTGGGIFVGRIHQLFLLAVSQGKGHPADWAQIVWQILSTQGQQIIKEGQALETSEENLAELTAQATTFAEKHLPILKALQLA